MNKAVPWSVKGVDFDARAAATEAAQRAGMTLGDWLNHVIAEQAETLGVAVEDVGREARLEAVKDRLTRLSRDPDPAPEPEVRPARGSRRSDRDELAYPRRASASHHEEPADEGEHHGRAHPARRHPPASALARHEPREATYFRRPARRLVVKEAAAPSVDAEALLDDAILAFERSQRDMRQRTDAALGKVVERLAGIEQQLDQRSDEAVQIPVRNAISRLEKRIEILAERAESPAVMDVALKTLDHKLTAIARRLDQPPPKPPVERDSDMERIESKLNALMVNMENSARARQQARERPPAQALRREAARTAGPLPTPRSIDAAVAEILQRQRTLDDEPAAATNQPAPRGAPRFAAQLAAPDISALKSDIASLSDRLEEMRREVSERDERHGVETRAVESRLREPSLEVQSLREQIAEMSEMLAALAPRDSVVAIESAVRDLGLRIETSKQDGVRDTQLAPIEHLFAELHQTIQDFAPTATIDRLESAIRALSERIEGVGTAGLPPQDLGIIRRQTEETRDLLANAIAQPLPIETIEKSIGTLHDRIDALVQLGPSRDFTQSLAKSLDEIRVALARPAPAPSLEPLEGRLDLLSRKLDDAIAADETGLRFDALTGRIDALHHSLATSIAQPVSPPRADTSVLENSLRDLSSKLDASRFAPALEPLEERIEILARKLDDAIADDDTGGKFDALAGRIEEVHRSLASRLGEVSRVPAPERLDTSRLESMVAELAEKIDTVRAPKADAQALAALQVQIEKVVQRLDRSEANLGSLSSLERTISDLFTQLEESHSATEAAARDAARHVVREAMLEIPAAAPSSEAISLEISDLRALQDSADRRTHATLTAVHETLEKVVDRLAMLEDEITEVRPAEPHGNMPASDLARGAPAAPPLGRMAAAALGAVPATPEPYVLIEPGSGVPPARRNLDTLGAGAPPVTPEPSAEAKSAQASFIAAARRAAQAASAEAKSSGQAQRVERGGDVDSELAKARARAKAAATSLLTEEATDDEPNAVEQARSFLLARKRPILLSLAGVVILLGALQVVRSIGDQAPPPAVVQPVAAPKSASAPADTSPAVATPATGTPAPVTPAPAPAIKSTPGDGASLISPDPQDNTAQYMQPGPTVAGSPSLQAALGSAQNFTPPPSATVDPAPVATIPHLGVPVIPAPAAVPPAAGITAGLREAATGGNAAAQYLLGVAYADGQSVARDYSLAAQWLIKASAQNLAPAEYRLASLYEKGLGLPRDASQAANWYQRAANLGNIRAMHNLAVLSAEGTDGKPDYATAAQWFGKAANFGVRDSQYNLAILYARGLGVAQDYGASYKWFAIAAAQGDTDSASKRDEIAAKLSADQITAAKAQAAAFVSKTPDSAANDVAMPALATPAAKTQASTKPVMSHL